MASLHSQLDPFRQMVRDARRPGGTLSRFVIWAEPARCPLIFACGGFFVIESLIAMMYALDGGEPFVTAQYAGPLLVCTWIFLFEEERTTTWHSGWAISFSIAGMALTTSSFFFAVYCLTGAVYPDSLTNRGHLLAGAALTSVVASLALEFAVFLITRRWSFVEAELFAIVGVICCAVAYRSTLDWLHLRVAMCQLWFPLISAIVGMNLHLSKKEIALF